MAPKNSAEASIHTGNGTGENTALRQECEQLRQSLVAATKERDDYRAMLYACIRASITENDKAEMEKDLRAVIADGGVSFRDALYQIIQARGS